MWCYIISYYIISYHITLYYTILYCIVLYYIYIVWACNRCTHREHVQMYMVCVYVKSHIRKMSPSAAVISQHHYPPLWAPGLRGCPVPVALPTLCSEPWQSWAEFKWPWSHSKCGFKQQSLSSSGPPFGSKLGHPYVRTIPHPGFQWGKETLKS